MPSAAIERCRCVLVGPPWPPGRDALLRLFIVSYALLSSDAPPTPFPLLDDDLDELLPLADDVDVEEWPR